jgi:hypothetical protein
MDQLVIWFRFKRRYRYLWIVLAWKVGNRSEKTLQKVWLQAPPSYRRKLVYTNFMRRMPNYLRPGSIALVTGAAAKPV